ncbi:hypothetical protein EcWSU1_02909 [Enterobacter ludwigii]|uniref:Uncharacterized protein n=1 Tax=Enterobacter ludwigii TaxID=299767 RepID=G8LI15_9ENTR|nr:hypothetical protein EcWSU1_02909 [Enterobacter ludwigii]
MLTTLSKIHIKINNTHIRQSGYYQLNKNTTATLFF